MFDIEKSVGFLLAKAHQKLYGRFRDLLAPHGLTPQQFALLAFLWREDELSQKELSEKTDIDRTTLSGLVDRLQKLGLVERRPHPEDRRAWLVALTKAGRAQEAELSALSLRLRQQLHERLGSEEYAQLCQLLVRLRKVSEDD